MIDIENARELVERARRRASSGVQPIFNGEVADTIAALLDEVERLNSPVVQSEWQKLVDERERLIAENRSIRTLMDLYNLGGWTDSLRLIQERDALARKLDAVREVYAGMGGFVAQTAPEGYCLRIIEQMAHAAMKGASDES